MNMFVCEHISALILKFDKLDKIPKSGFNIMYSFEAAEINKRVITIKLLSCVTDICMK